MHPFTQYLLTTGFFSSLVNAGGAVNTITGLRRKTAFSTTINSAKVINGLRKPLQQRKTEENE